MCTFLSVIVLKNGDVLHHPMLDSHSDLVVYFNLPDASAYHQHFAKAELLPKNWLDPDSWTWRIDEETRPGWLDDVEAQAEEKARSIARHMILTDTSTLPRLIPRLIVDGCWIVCGAVVIRDVRGGRIMRVQDYAQISDVCGSAQISGVRDHAQISGVWDHAQISDVWGRARISDVWSSARISDVRDHAQISGVWGSAQISGVWDHAQISGVWVRAQISDVRDRAQISDVWGSARISGVRDHVT